MASSSTKKPNSGADTFPDDLVMELLIRLPGKQVARCKCVCKSWRSVIKSAHFKDVYGTRQRGLILHRLEPDYNSDPLHIYYSPVRGLDEAGPEEFSCLNKLGTSGGYYSMTQIVNGLLCIDYVRGGLNLFNVCTGERMVIPDLSPLKDHERPPTSYLGQKRPAFYLGFDPASRRYKILRLTLEHPIEAHVMTLRSSSSSSSSTWRELNIGWNVRCPWVLSSDVASKEKIFPNDGLLCWPCSEYYASFQTYLILFDFNKEKFQEILLPSKYLFTLKDNGEGFVRAQFMEHTQRLAVSLWCFSRIRPIHTRVCRRLDCFVMDDDEGKRWTSRSIDFPEELDQEKAVFVVPNGNLSATSATEMVLINTAENDVYCPDHTSKMKVQFRAGKQPDLPVDLLAASILSPGHSYFKKFTSTLSCLSDANNLYLPLDDILK